MTLQDLGVRYGTDKATYHNFCEYYESLFNSKRDEKLRFLEIGILNGSSLKMWHDYFVNSEISGADILDRKYLENNRIKTFIVNQEDRTQLLNIPGEFDIIIDDGGHTMLQQQVTLVVMFQKLKAGGSYVIEDLHTSLPNFEGHGYGCTELNNTLRLVKDLQKKTLTGEYFIDSVDFENLLNTIESIDIHETQKGSITCSIVKKINH